MKSNKINQTMTRLVAILIFLIPSLAFAQQDAMFTQYFSNKLILNPAYAGARDAIAITGLYRNQWTGFEGAPVTQTLSAHMPVFKGKSGVGIAFLHDKIGIADNTIITGSYAYRIDFGAGRLSFGLNGELRRRAMNWAESNPLTQGDPSVAWTTQNLFLPNFGAGIYFDTDKFYAGISMPNMLENQLKYLPQNAASQNLSQLRRHYYAMMGVGINLSESLVLKPQALFKYVQNAPAELDINLGLLINSRLLVGGTFRTGDSYDAYFQFWLNKQMRIGYAFDFAFTRLNPTNYGSHELMIGLELARKKNGFIHPRYF